MKRRLIVLGLIIVILIALVIAFLINKSDGDVPSDITMIIESDTLTNISATVEITDESGMDNTYNEWFRIDEYVNGQWQELEVIADDEVIWRDIGYKISDKNTLHLDVFWEEIYGELDKGKYRVVKEVNDEYIMAEFSI